MKATFTVFDGRVLEQDEARARAKMLTVQYNAASDAPPAERESILRKLLGGMGRNVTFEAPFRCKFGSNIFVGDNIYANYDCIILDSLRVEIGSNVLIGPRVGIYDFNHALDPEERAAGLCTGNPVKIGNNVWIGAGSQIMAGVTIGDNAVIGAGSVVTTDIPAGVIAAGVPCRVIRQITEQDKASAQMESGQSPADPEF